MSLEEFDVWMSVNGERLRCSNVAMQELLPYVNRRSSSEVLQPLVARLEAATTDVTYSDFDAGHVSALYAHAGSSFRAGLDAIAVGDGQVAGECVSQGLSEYQDALECLLEQMAAREGPPVVTRRRHHWWLVAAVLLVLWVLVV